MFMESIHELFGIASTASPFLTREVNKAFAEATGDRVDVYLPLLRTRGLYIYTNRIRGILAMLRARGLHNHRLYLSLHMRVPFTLHPLPVNGGNSLHGLWYFGHIELSVNLSIVEKY